jgi:hypothetical protein
MARKTVKTTTTMKRVMMMKKTTQRSVKEVLRVTGKVHQKDTNERTN